MPERLDLILAKMTAKLPKSRYQTCEEAIKDLESLGFSSESLSFLNEKPVEPEVTPEEYEAVGQTQVTAASKSRADVDFAESAAPSLDPDIWFIQTKLPDGTTATRKYTTAQINKMLDEGTMTPTAKASHMPTEGFRTLGTYKEFQGAALGTLAKKAADKNTARYRGLYKKIEEKELEREKEEMERRGDDETTMQATRRYWTGILVKRADHFSRPRSVPDYLVSHVVIDVRAERPRGASHSRPGSENLANRPIHFRPTILEPMQFVFACHEDAMLVARFPGSMSAYSIAGDRPRSRQKFAGATQDATHADEAKASLGADAIDGGVVEMVFEGARRD